MMKNNKELYGNSEKTYVIKQYNNMDFRETVDNYKTDSYDDMKNKVREFIHKGPIEITNTETGISVRYTDPDKISYEGEIGIALESESEIEFCKKAYKNAKRVNESNESQRTYTLEEIKIEYGI